MLAVAEEQKTVTKRVENNTMATLVQDDGPKTGAPIPTTLSPQDIIIPIMGITGSGKSQFISLCTDEPVDIGHELYSSPFSLRAKTPPIPWVTLKRVSNDRHRGSHHIQPTS